MKTSWPELGEAVAAKGVIEINPKAVIAAAIVAAAIRSRVRATNFSQTSKGLLPGGKSEASRSRRGNALFGSLNPSDC